MKFVNEIAVDAPPDELFKFLADVERVAPCLPGASVEHGSGEDFHGTMKVKVGPIRGTYKGTMRFVELDRERRRAVMSARGDEAGGQGNAEAWIETEVAESNGSSQLRVVTDLQLRGRVAQFGRGTIERIAQRMFSEFAHNIEQQMADGASPADEERGAPAEAETGAVAETGTGAPPEKEMGASDEQETAAHAGEASRELDALGLLAGPLVKRAAPVLLPALIGFGYGYLLGRLRELTR